MAIVPGNSTSGLTTTITRPAAASGDYIIAVALRDGSNNPPNVPTGWTTIQTKTLDSAGSVLACIVTDGTTPSETFGSATSVVMTAYSGVTGIGASNQTTTVGTTINWSALTLTGTNGGSWIVLGAVTRADGTTVTAETPPSGFTFRVASTDAVDESAIHDSNGGVSSFAGASVAIGGASTGNVGFALELLGAAAGGGGSTISGAGSSAGVATVAGAGASTATASGSVSASATATAGGASTAASAGSSAGIASTSGTGSSIAVAVGSASGSATVSGASGAGGSTASGAGSASGSATVSGGGASIATAAGTATGGATVSGTAAGGVIPTARQRDALDGRPAKFSGVRPSQKPDDPRTALQRLADGYRATAIERLISRIEATQDKPIKAAVEAAEEAKEQIAEVVAPVLEPAILIQWDAVLEDLRQAQEREAQAHALHQAIETLRAMQQQAREAEEDEDEALMLLFAA